eukprot:scaffold20288_cov193-Skeletonema_dohrnii-CCMP3373.AAC.1
MATNVGGLSAGVGGPQEQGTKKEEEKIIGSLREVAPGGQLARQKVAVGCDDFVTCGGVPKGVPDFPPVKLKSSPKSTHASKPTASRSLASASRRLSPSLGCYNR